VRRDVGIPPYEVGVGDGVPDVPEIVVGTDRNGVGAHPVCARGRIMNPPPTVVWGVALDWMNLSVSFADTSPQRGGFKCAAG